MFEISFKMVSDLLNAFVRQHLLNRPNVVIEINVRTRRSESRKWLRLVLVFLVEKICLRSLVERVVFELLGVVVRVIVIGQVLLSLFCQGVIATGMILK